MATLLTNPYLGPSLLATLIFKHCINRVPIINIRVYSGNNARVGCGTTKMVVWVIRSTSVLTSFLKPSISILITRIRQGYEKQTIRYRTVKIRT